MLGKIREATLAMLMIPVAVAGIVAAFAANVRRCGEAAARREEVELELLKLQRRLLAADVERETERGALGLKP